MRAQDLFPLEIGKHGTLDECGSIQTPGRKVGPLERRFWETSKNVFMVTEMGNINIPILMFFKEIAKQASLEVAGN